jgi:hypothetical protein
MKTLIAFAAVFASFATLRAANSSALDEVQNAAQKLAAADNYSWTITSDSSLLSSPSHGKAESEGFACLDFPTQDHGTQAILKDDRGMIKTPAGWKWLGDADDNVEVPVCRWITEWRLHIYTLPAREAWNFANHVEDLTVSNGIYSGLLPNSGNFAQDVKCTVKFWIQDGVLTKYQVNCKGTIKAIHGLTKDQHIDQTTTVEIQDIGTTKIAVPEEVKGKLS